MAYVRYIIYLTNEWNKYFLVVNVLIVFEHIVKYDDKTPNAQNANWESVNIYEWLECDTLLSE